MIETTEEENEEEDDLWLRLCPHYACIADF